MNPRETPQDGASPASSAFDPAVWNAPAGRSARRAPRADESAGEPSATSPDEAGSQGDSHVVDAESGSFDDSTSSESLPVSLSSDGPVSEFGDDGDDERLLLLARDGDRESFERLFSRYREDLRRVVAWRTDPRLRARVDPSDVVQEAQLEAFRRLDDFLRRRPMGFRLWLRKTAQEQLAKAFRRHVGTQMRSAGRETSLNDSESPGIGAIAGTADTPSQHMVAQEAAQAVWEGLAELAEHDREILIMRNYEGLNYDEICVVLDIEPAAARKRYGRALLRLRQRLTARGLTEDAS